MIPIVYIQAKDARRITGYGSTRTHEFLNEFKGYVEKHYQKFKPFKKHQIIKRDGSTKHLYNGICFTFFVLNRELLLENKRYAPDLSDELETIVALFNLKKVGNINDNY